MLNLTRAGGRRIDAAMVAEALERLGPPAPRLSLRRQRLRRRGRGPAARCRASTPPHPHRALRRLSRPFLVAPSASGLRWPGPAGVESHGNGVQPAFRAVPLRRRPFQGDARRRPRNGAPLHLLVLPDARRRRRLGRDRRRRDPAGCGAADQLSLQHRRGTALLLRALRNLHPPYPPLEPAPVRRQRRLSRRPQPVRFRRGPGASTASTTRTTPAARAGWPGRCASSPEARGHRGPQAPTRRSATSSARDRLEVRPGLSIPKRWTRPGRPCSAGPSITEIGGGLARAGELRADAGIIRRQRPVRQARPVAADRTA